MALCLFWFFCCCVRVDFRGGLRDWFDILFPIEPGVILVVGVTALRDAVGEGVDDMIMCCVQVLLVIVRGDELKLFNGLSVVPFFPDQKYC